MSLVCLRLALLLFVTGISPQPQQLLNRAVQQFQVGHYRAAEQLLNELLVRSPNSVPAHDLRGLIFMKEGKYGEAAREFDTVLHLQPDYAAAHVNLGSALEGLHQDGRAREEFIVALRIHPDDIVALSGVGFIYARAGDTSAAVPYLRHAHTLDPLNIHTSAALAAEYIDLKQFSEADSVVNDLLRIGPGAKQPLYSLALLALASGNPQLGAKCVAWDADLRHSYYNESYQKAVDLVSASKYSQALTTLEVIRDDLPQNGAVSADAAAYYDLLGTAYYELDEPKQAVDVLQEAIRLEPSNPDHYYKLGMMFLKHRTGDGAVLVFQAALKVQPGVPKLWMGLGLSHYIQGNSEEAKRELHYAISLDPKYLPAYIVLCDLLSQFDQEDELLQAVGKAMAIEPKDYLVRYYYGIALARKDDGKAAVLQFQRSIALNDHFPGSYFKLGEVLAKSGNLTGAIDAFDRCAKLDPDMAEAHYKLFRLYHSSGRQELASNQLKTFLQLRGKDEEENVRTLIFTVAK